MLLNDFVIHANYVFKTEKKGLRCIDLNDGFILRVERRELNIDEVKLTNKKSKERIFKSLDRLFKIIYEAGYIGVLKVGVNYEDS